MFETYIETHQLAILTGGVLIVSLLYSSVGHAGASGYIAVMSLLNLAPERIRFTALFLNIVVAMIAAWQFYRAGHFSRRVCLPIAAVSVPMAFAGGYLLTPAAVFQVLVGIVLLTSAARLLLRPPAEVSLRPLSREASVALGGGLGLLAGLTGTGGGVFLTPALVFGRWASVKTAGAVSAVFILINSMAGLGGFLFRHRAWPGMSWPLVAAVIVGGSCGAYLGSRRFDLTLVKRILAVVLTVAGVRLIVG